MMKRISLFLFLIQFSHYIYAQPQPCNPAAMTPTCVQACVVCDIDGFTGINNNPTPGVAPPGFCTTIAHHIQWIAFIAGSTNLTLNISVTNCNIGQGLEAGIYLSTDCQNFQLVTICDTDIPNNTAQLFTNTVPLIVGQYYYLVIDGNMDDVCNYTINVISGTTLVPPLPNSGTINGNLETCTGVNTVFSVNPPSGATLYQWTVDGAPAGNSQQVSVNFPTQGTHEVCVSAANVCDVAPPVCATVLVKPTPPPVIINKTICAGECITVADTTICQGGNYVLHRPSSNGCDSVTNISIINIPIDTTTFSSEHCIGDTVWVNNNPYIASGQYTETFQSAQECDSVVQFQLAFFDCILQANILTNNVLCAGAGNGQISFQVVNGIAPFTYTWEETSSTTQLSGSGDIAVINTTETIDLLPPGNYSVRIQDNELGVVYLTTTITQPDSLMMDMTTTNYNGYAIPCAGGTTFIALETQGGSPPYQYVWNNGSTLDSLDNLVAGTYIVTITDSNDCIVVNSIEITQPLLLQVFTTAISPTCDSTNGGIIHIDSVAGGAGDILFKINNSPYSTLTQYNDLAAGNYTISAKDANECRDSATHTIIFPQYLSHFLTPDTTILLGEQIPLQFFIPAIYDSLAWSPPLGLSCTGCLNPMASPLVNTTYTVTAFAANYCPVADSVRISLEKTPVYIPNIINLESEGTNAYFTIFSGVSLSKILKLSIYSRWGELIHEQTDLLPNNIIHGWDGTYKGVPVDNGVFIWVANVQYLDGTTFLLKGDVTVIR